MARWQTGGDGEAEIHPRQDHMRRCPRQSTARYSEVAIEPEGARKRDRGYTRDKCLEFIRRKAIEEEVRNNQVVAGIGPRSRTSIAENEANALGRPWDLGNPAAGQGDHFRADIQTIHDYKPIRTKKINEEPTVPISKDQCPPTIEKPIEVRCATPVKEWAEGNSFKEMVYRGKTIE